MKIHTVGNISDFTRDVVPANLFVPFWWTDQGLTDHGNVDFGSDTPAGRLCKEMGPRVNESLQ